jgi:hypothetical protein
MAGKPTGSSTDGIFSYGIPDMKNLQLVEISGLIAVQPEVIAKLGNFLLPTIRAERSFRYRRIASQDSRLHEIIEDRGGRGCIDDYAVPAEIVVCTKHNLTVRFDLNMNNPAVPSKRDLGSC